jgi:hypothetical protein
MPRDTSKLDAAILAHRADPSDANRERVLAAMRDHVDGFYREVVAECMAMQAGESVRRGAVCPRCGGESRYSGTVVWCECSGWLDGRDAETAHAHETGPKLDAVDDADYPGDYDGLTGRI